MTNDARVRLRRVHGCREGALAETHLTQVACRYYKNGCRRVQRLKEVWGEDAYSCFHTKTPCEGMDTVRNDANATVGTKANIKGAPMAAESSSSGLPSEILAVVVIAGVIGAACLAATCYTLARSFNKSPNPA